MPVLEICFLVIPSIFMLLMIGYMIWLSKEEDKFLDEYYQTMFGHHDDNWD